MVRHYYSSQAVVRTVRCLQAGDEILDNYGYHYAVMPREERQRKLHSQAAAENIDCHFYLGTKIPASKYFYF